MLYLTFQGIWYFLGVQNNRSKENIRFVYRTNGMPSFASEVSYLDLSAKRYLSILNTLYLLSLPPFSELAPSHIFPVSMSGFVAQLGFFPPTHPALQNSPTFLNATRSRLPCLCSQACFFCLMKFLLAFIITCLPLATLPEVCKTDLQISFPSQKLYWFTFSSPCGFSVLSGRLVRNKSPHCSVSQPVPTYSSLALWVNCLRTGTESC